MMLEADELVVDAAVWDRATRRPPDPAAIAQLKVALRGVHLYAHPYMPAPTPGGHVVVTLRQLDQLCTRLSVRALIGFDDGLDPPQRSRRTD